MSAESSSAPVGLFSKLASVMREVSRVPKRGHNSFHRYDYVTEADLVETVRAKLALRNVALLVSANSAEQIGNDVTKLHITIVFACGDTRETHTVTAIGYGQDKGDKGVYKAFTGAMKYALMKTFLVPTGDDPELANDRERSALCRTGQPSTDLTLTTSSTKGQAMTAAATSLDTASALVIPVGDFKGRPLGEVYEANASKLQGTADWARRKSRFPDFVHAVALLADSTGRGGSRAA